MDIFSVLKSLENSILTLHYLFILYSCDHATFIRNYCQHTSKLNLHILSFCSHFQNDIEEFMNLPENNNQGDKVHITHSSLPDKISNL